MAKKLLSMLLALSMMLTVLAACNNEPVDDVENSDQQQEEVQGDEQGGEEVVSDVLNLVVDGASDYVIVRGENAYISEVTASTELQSYLKQISGVEIPIVTDSTEPVEKEIVVGKTNREADGEFDREELGDDGLVIKTNGQKLFLVGGEKRGTLYAVYEFLEAYLGCRFFLPEVEKVPEQKTISLEQIAEDKQIPVFIDRMTSWPEYYDNDSSIYPKRRFTDVSNQAYGGGFRWIRWCHTFEELVPITVYGEEHPEWFTIDVSEYGYNAEGMRVDGQICTTNPEVIAIAIETTRNILNQYKDNSDYKIISITQNDNSNYCTCDNCMALCEAEGSYAAATLQFTNEIATALKDEFPDILFETFAYWYTRNAPKTIKPAENVVVRICTIEECFTHTLTEHDGRITGSDDAMVQNTFSQDISDWSEIAHTMWVWDYTTNYSHYQAPHPNFNVLRENVRYFAENNVRGVYEQGHYQSEGAEFSGLRVYLISKLLWDPYMSEEEYQYHINDYLEGVYGPGWENIREWFDLLHEETKDVCIGCFADMEDMYDFGEPVEVHAKNEIPEDLTVEMIKNYETVDWTKYWYFYKDLPGVPELITRGYELWGAAMDAAETDLQRHWIERDSLQVKYLESYYLGTRIQCGNSTVGKIVGNFMQAHPDEFSTEDHINYRRVIVKLANEQTYSAYAEFNKELYDAYVKLGINSITHDYANYLASTPVDLTQLPEDWLIIE